MRSHLRWPLFRAKAHISSRYTSPRYHRQLAGTALMAAPADQEHHQGRHLAMSTPAPTATKPSCKVIKADTIAQKLLAEAKEMLARIQSVEDVQPCLAAFLANGDPAALQYAEWSKKTCEENGVTFRLHQLDKEDLEEAILAANADMSVDGIIVYYPIWPSNPSHDRYIQETVALSKDVEGLCHMHLSNMYHNVRFLGEPSKGRKSILPCTPLAIIKALEHLGVYNQVLESGNRLFGKTVTVINRSEVNGRPLAALLANDGATVYSVDIGGVQEFTRGTGLRFSRHQVLERPGWGLPDVVPRSDVVIGGVPAEAFKIPADLLRDGVVAINFSSFRNFDGPATKERASIYLTSVGKVTIAVLLRNLVRLIANRPRPEGSPNADQQKARTEAFLDG